MKYRGKRSRIVVVDDHDIARMGLVTILRGVPEFSVVAEAADAPGALAEVARCQPDLVLLDVRMPNTAGLDAARQIRARWPAIRVVMVSSWDFPEYVLEAFQAGARGYLSKGASCAEIVDEVQRALRDEPLRTSKLPQPFLREAADTVPSDAHPVIARLTPRQRDVLSLIGAGLRSREIAERLKIMPSTVRKITEQVYSRLGLSNRTQAAMYWVVAAHQPQIGAAAAGF
jgi:DNA-binding NarL/FixJ family response regulator